MRAILTLCAMTSAAHAHAQAPDAGRAAFRSVYQELVEIDTNLYEGRDVLEGIVREYAK